MEFEPIHPRIRQYKHKEFVIGKKEGRYKETCFKKRKYGSTPSKRSVIEIIYYRYIKIFHPYL